MPDFSDGFRELVKVIRTAIIGGTGYTGAELLRLLVAHPDVEIVAVSSRSEAGKPLTGAFPNLKGYLDLDFSDPSDLLSAKPDLVFFATPHGVAQASMKEIASTGARVIDLSADFRIKDQQLWEEVYSQPHQSPEFIADAVYGLPEVNRSAIAGSNLVACPGCYPTSVQLAMIPLIEKGLIDPASIVAYSGSGVSGAGRNAKVPYLLTEASENFQAYGTAGHRHEPEIVQGLRAVQAETDTPAEVLLLPHLVPMIRGIHSTVVADLKDKSADIQSVFEARYVDEPFVEVLPLGSQPQTRYVRGTNLCQLAVHVRGDRVVVLSVEDNLTKGASGQAVQCMNIMYGLDEKTGLNMPAMLPG